MKHILYIFIYALLFSACATSKEQVRTGAFYEIAPRYVRSQGNMDYFMAYGKGVNENECRSNAVSGLLKTLIYQGIRDGKNINPILNEPQSISNFKNREQAAMSALLRHNGLMDTNGSPTNRMRQSDDKNALYNMGFEIGVNRNLLTVEITGSK